MARFRSCRGEQIARRSKSALLLALGLLSGAAGALGSCSPGPRLEGPDAEADSCTSGPCCEDGMPAPAGAICELRTEYGCLGEGCGAATASRIVQGVCLGSDGPCGGPPEFGPWTAASLCGPDQVCGTTEAGASCRDCASGSFCADTAGCRPCDSDERCGATCEPCAEGSHCMAGTCAVVTQIALGGYFGCATLSTGAIRCWGENSLGQLGLGHVETIGDDELPASAGNIESGTSANLVAAGHMHACALNVSGDAVCWGSGHDGQLGYGNALNIGDDETPASAGTVDVGGEVVRVAAGGDHTCAVLRTGSLRCWGPRTVAGHPDRPWEDDAIGDDETPASAGDVNVGDDVVQVAAGYVHACALLRSGAVRCWGVAQKGQLGYGNTEFIGDDPGEVPETAGDVDVGAPVEQIVSGSSAEHTCAVLVGGRLRCWGENDHGQLGYGHTRNIGDDETPSSAGDVDVGGVVLQAAAGGRHTCAVLAGGRVRCWGNNEFGQLGTGDTRTIGDDETPASSGEVDVGGPVAQVAAGSLRTCALLENGTVRCWGDGRWGGLGYGNTENIGDDETPASAGDVALF